MSNLYHMNTLNDQVALVTGSSRGIGAAIAAPPRANSAAIAAPMPRELPVTSAT